MVKHLGNGYEVYEGADSYVNISDSDAERLRESGELDKFNPENIFASITLIYSRDIRLSYNLERTIISVWNENNEGEVSEIEQISILDLAKTLKYINSQGDYGLIIDDIVNRLNDLIEVVSSTSFYISFRRIRDGEKTFKQGCLFI